MADRAKYVEVYADKSGKPRWRKISANGKNVGSSGESFSSWTEAVQSAHREVEGTTIEVRVNPEQRRQYLSDALGPSDADGDVGVAADGSDA